MTKQPASSSSSNNNLFSTLSRLDSDDIRADKKRRILASSSIAKSKAARSQSSLYSDLISVRILLQRSLANTTDTSSKFQQECNDLLSKLLKARRTYLRNDDDNDDESPEYANLLQQGQQQQPSRDQDMNELLQSEYESCRDTWKTTFNRRYSDLKLHTGMTVQSSKKFKVMNKSFWDQVENIVANDKLLRDTETKREDDDDDDDDDDKEEGHNKKTVSQLFDDGKLYQLLLRDFISSGPNSNMTIRELSKNQRKKKKKEVDRRASKGRKIRYNVHDKMTNFMFPLKKKEPMIDTDDWFKSLFGGVANKTTRE